jgi:flagellar hook-associated protein 1
VSDFLGLRIALSSLQAQRRGMDVTGQNLANVNTDGYTRQRVGLAADAGPATGAIHSRWTGSGMGVSMTGVDRLQDAFLQMRSFQEHATKAGLAETQSTLASIEMAFAEPGDTALASQLSDFWSGWDDLANRPDDVAARAQLIERATTLMAGFRQTDEALAGLSAGAVERLAASVADVNSTAARIADLNRTIQGAVNAGLSPNDLLDQRDLLISRLSEAVGATTRPGEGGAMDVFVGGTAIVRGIRSDTLRSEIAADGTARVVWAKDDYPATVNGAAGGMMSTVNEIIPRYRAKLAAVLDHVVSSVNSVHADGVALDGSTGRAFFQPSTDGRGWVVNPHLTLDPKLIGAGAAGAGGRDGSVAQRLAAIADSASGPDAGYRELIVRLGVEAQGVNRRVSIQNAITREVDAARESKAGVSLDEEMTNLIAYQHAYDAAARFMTTIDSMLDTLINRTGLVGR